MTAVTVVTFKCQNQNGQCKLLRHYSLVHAIFMYTEQIYIVNTTIDFLLTKISVYSQDANESKIESKYNKNLF